MEYADRLTVVSVDVQSQLGRELAREYGSFTPTFVFLDADGVEVWRAIGSLNPEDVRQELD